MKDILLDEYFSLWTSINQTSNMMLAVREKEIGQYGLSPIEQRLLILIPLMETAIGEVTPSDLSRWLIRKKGSISGLLNRMEKRGLIQKIPHQNSKKSIVIKVTEKGEELSQQAHTRGVFIKELMSALTEEERHQLWMIMGKLRSLTLKELRLPQKPPYPQFL